MKKGNLKALLPIGVFLVLYLGLGILFEYVLKAGMGFYNIPIVVIFVIPEKKVKKTGCRRKVFAAGFFAPCIRFGHGWHTVEKRKEGNRYGTSGYN